MAALHHLNILPESVVPRLGRFRDCFFRSQWFSGPDVFGGLSAPNLIFATSLARRPPNQFYPESERKFHITTLHNAS